MLVLSLVLLFWCSGVLGSEFWVLGQFGTPADINADHGVGDEEVCQKPFGGHSHSHYKFIGFGDHHPLDEYRILLFIDVQRSSGYFRV